MVAIGQQVVSLTLALLVSLSQWFSEGVTAFKAEEFAAATDAFSKVIAADVDPNPLREEALYFRAQCLHRLDQDDAALADLKALLESHPTGPLAGLAKADFKALSGKEWDGLDLSTPELAWASFHTAVMAKSVERTAKCCTDKMKAELIEEVADDPDSWDEAVEEIGPYRLVGVVYNEAKDKAVIDIAKVGDNDRERLIMFCEDGNWRLAREYRDRDWDGAGGASGNAKETLDRARLQQLAVAAEMYHGDHDNAYPKALSELKDYVGGLEQLGVSAVNGKAFQCGATRGGEVFWVYPSGATDGKRLVAIGGVVQPVAEDAFRRQAAAAGVRIPENDAAIEVTAAEKQAVAALILELGHPEYQVRRGARTKLKAFGEKAIPQLRQAMLSADPEIAAQARELVGEL